MLIDMIRNKRLALVSSKIKSEVGRLVKNGRDTYSYFWSPTTEFGYYFGHISD